MKLSAVVLTKNEEENIEGCLASLNFCDEIIVIDDGSTDKTLNIAKKHGARIFQRALKGDFAASRNFGLEKAKGEWVLFVDADERVSKSLTDEIAEEISKPVSFPGFYIVRRDIMWGREVRFGEVGDAKFIRLAKQDAGKWEGKVHEKWHVSDKIGLLNGLLLHYPHHTVSEFLNDINFYTDLRSIELYRRGTKVYWWSIVLYPLGKFIINYLLRRGFLDGVVGLVMALMMSFHSFLVRGKLWLLWQKDQ